MARAGIYKSEVVRARNNLLAMGRYPSIDAIRGELGDTGSKGTIHRYLKEIEEEEGGSTAGTADIHVKIGLNAENPRCASETVRSAMTNL